MPSPAAAMLPTTLLALGSPYPFPHLGRSHGYRMGTAGEYASSPGPCPSASCHFCVIVHSPVSQLITGSASFSPRSSVDSFGHALITHSCGCPFHGSAELQCQDGGESSESRWGELPAWASLVWALAPKCLRAQQGIGMA